MQIIEHARRFGKNARLEAQLSSGEWADLTKYMQASDQHAMSDPMRPRVYRKVREKIPGPNRAARNFARRVRVAELPARLDMTGGTGNMMVNICRSGTRQSAQDKARRLHQGPGGRGPTHPNKRLDAFGMTVRGDWDNGGGVLIKGGTARQRACYVRAVERWMLRADA
jgi:hypothetical protein